MNEATAYLHDLGTRVLRSYATLPGVAATAILGSTSEGQADQYSDLDLAVYYDAMPGEVDIRAVRATLGGTELLWTLGAYADGDFIESFRVHGVECQVVHTTVMRWEETIAHVLAGHEPGAPVHKAMSGALAALPVTGAHRLAAWQDAIRTYPHALRLAVVRHHLTFFRIWALMDRLESRDAGLWFRQTLVESSFNLLGVAAGLSRRYFTPFQFKRTRTFVAALDIAPSGLADRLDRLWTVSPHEAAEQLRQLVEETVGLVERHLPEVDTTSVRKALASRDESWSR